MPEFEYGENEHPSWATVDTPLSVPDTSAHPRRTITAETMAELRVLNDQYAHNETQLIKAVKELLESLEATDFRDHDPRYYQRLIETIESGKKFIPYSEYVKSDGPE